MPSDDDQSTSPGERNRNEALDCAVHAFAAKEYVRPPMRLPADLLKAKVARMTAQGLLPRAKHLGRESRSYRRRAAAIAVVGILGSITFAATS